MLRHLLCALILIIIVIYSNAHAFKNFRGKHNFAATVKSLGIFFGSLKAAQDVNIRMRKIVLSGPGQELAASEMVRKAYLGG